MNILANFLDYENLPPTTYHSIITTTSRDLLLANKGHPYLGCPLFANNNNK